MHRTNPADLVDAQAGCDGLAGNESIQPHGVDGVLPVFLPGRELFVGYRQTKAGRKNLRVCLEVRRIIFLKNDFMNRSFIATC